MPKELKSANIYKSTWVLYSKFLVILNTMLLIVFFSLILVDIYNSPFSDNDNREQTSLLNPTIQAKIIKDNCKEHSNKDLSCYSEKFSNLTKAKDIDLAIKTLLELEKIDPSARGCHLIAHKISITEVEKNPDNWKNLLEKINPLMCTFGFMHGVLEGHERFDPTFKIDEKNLEELCSYISTSAKKDIDLSCSHIMGHIVLTQKEGDIPSSIKLCEKTSKKLSYECAGGVFMENMTRHNLETHGIAKKIPWNAENISNQEKICSQYIGESSNVCWREMSHMYAIIAHNDPREVFKSCHQIPKESIRDDCYIHSVSSMPLSPEFKPDYLKFLCNSYRTQRPLYTRCYNDAVYFMILSSLDLLGNATSLCDSLDQPYHEECYKKIGIALNQIVPENKKRELCSKISPKYKEACITIS